MMLALTFVYIPVYFKDVMMLNVKEVDLKILIRMKTITSLERSSSGYPAFLQCGNEIFLGRLHGLPSTKENPHSNSGL